MVPAILIAVLLLLFAIGLPIAWSLGLASLVTLVAFTGVPLTVLPQRLFTGTDSFTLIAIPFFLLAGALMEEAGISERLIKLAQAFVGHIRGGLGGVSVGGSMLFSAVSGSGIAATAAMGKIMIPAMLKRGYGKDYAVSVQATAGAMGIIIPPSIVMILYSVISGASVGALFIGGVIPGVLMAASLLVTGYVIAIRRRYPVEERVPAAKIPVRLLHAIPALLMPVIILGGILASIVTATESAVLAVVYALIYGLITKRINVKRLFKTLYDTALSTGMIMLIVANASLFAWVITAERLPQALSQMLSGLSEKPFLILAVLVLILFVAGMFLDTSAALIVLIPVMLPIVQATGIDLVHFGVIAVLTLAIGLATPPVGLNLFVAADIAKVDVLSATRTLIPFIVALLLVVVAISLVPQLVLWLPGLFG